MLKHKEQIYAGVDWLLNLACIHECHFNWKIENFEVLLRDLDEVFLIAVFKILFIVNIVLIHHNCD